MEVRVTSRFALKLGAVAIVGVGLIGCTASATSQTTEPASASTSTKTTTTTVPVLPLAGKVITVDPGHNGNDSRHPSVINRLVFIGTKKKPCEATGTETNSGLTEAAFNFDVAVRLQKILKGLGAKVVLTRWNNHGVGPCITERARIGNRTHSNAAISIHADGAPSRGHGFHVIMPKSVKGWTDDIAASSHTLGIYIRNAYRAGTGLPYSTYLGRGRGYTVRDDLGGLNLSNVPKVFIETGNMKNRRDARLLSSPSFRQKIARSLANGLSKFLHPESG